MGFCIVQRDLDRHLSELSRLERQDAERDEIRSQVRIMDDAFAMSDPLFRDAMVAAAREILSLLGER